MNPPAKGAASGRRRRDAVQDGTPAHGVPQASPPGREAPRAAPPEGVAQHMPSRGTPQHTPPHGTPQHTPPHGVPQHTPPQGTPRHTPPHGTPQVRGGHPEQREPGGGWGKVGGAVGGSRAEAGRGDAPVKARGSVHPGPRQDYVDAFSADDALEASDDEDVFAAGARTARRAAPPRDPYRP